MRLVRDGGVYVAAKFLPGALGVATTSALTHLLSPAEYGRYGAALLLTGIGATILFDWIGLAFMRLHEARADDPRTIPTFAAIAAAMLALSAIPAAAALCLLPRADRALAAAGVLMLWCYGAFELLARVELARFRPRRYLLMNTGRAVLVAAGTIAAASRAGHAPAVALATAAGLALALALGPVGAIRLRAGIDPALARTALRFGAPYALSMTLLALSTTFWRAIVGADGGAAALGTVTAAAALAQNTLLLLGAAIGSATYPLAVRRLERGDAAAFRRQLEHNWTILFGALAPAAAGLALLAPDLARVLVGPEFRAGVAPLLPVLALASLLGGLRSFHLDHAFQLGRKPGLQVEIAAVASALGLGLTVALVPRYGAMGAAAATVASMAVAFAHAACRGRRAVRMPIGRGSTLHIAAATALMAVVVRLVPGGHEAAGLALRIAAGGLAYALAIAPLLPRERRAARRQPISLAGGGGPVLVPATSEARD